MYGGRHKKRLEEKIKDHRSPPLKENKVTLLNHVKLNLIRIPN